MSLEPENCNKTLSSRAPILNQVQHRLRDLSRETMRYYLVQSGVTNLSLTKSRLKGRDDYWLYES